LKALNFPFNAEGRNYLDAVRDIYTMDFGGFVKEIGKMEPG